MWFQHSSDLYKSSKSKINFALIYLSGSALEWFELALLDPDFEDEEPDWLYSWDEFLKELCTNFGPTDPIGDAEDKLNNLKMKENQRIFKYNVDFNRLSAHL